MSTNRLIIVVLFSYCVAITYAQYTKNLPTHFISVNVAGGEANTLATTDAVKNSAGGAAQVHAAYEVNKKGFFFNVGLGAVYMATANAIEDFSDAFDRVDNWNEERNEHIYRYLYSDYYEKQSTWAITLPIQFGYQSNYHIYAAFGATLRLPMTATFASSTTMFTQGEYPSNSEPFRNKWDYGFYEPDTYTRTGNSKALKDMQVAITAEIGSLIPLPKSMKKMRMRAGVYMEYGMRVASSAEIPMIDYSEVDLTLNQPNVQDIKFNSWVESYPEAYKNLQVGLRLTYLFDITPDPYECMCEPWWW